MYTCLQAADGGDAASGVVPGLHKRARMGKVGMDAYVIKKKDIGDALGRYVARGNGVPNELASPEFRELLDDIAAAFGGEIQHVSRQTITRRADKVGGARRAWLNDFLKRLTLTAGSYN